MATYQWHQGHMLDVLPQLKDASVHCCITSPPYFGLRDYGLIGRVWDGEAGCAHVWGQALVEAVRGTAGTRTTLGGGRIKRQQSRLEVLPQGAFCQRCGAWKGNLGLEPDVESYVRHLVQIFREVKRVLRDDGTCWLVLGDSYTSGGRTTHGTRVGHKQQTNRGMNGTRDPARLATPPGLKPKDLVGIPWRVAFALQADGWYLRSDIIWHKPNVMPNSQQDRPTTAHEYVFLLTKGQRYFYDSEAIKERAVNGERFHGDYAKPGVLTGALARTNGRTRAQNTTATRTRRSVWTIPTAPYKDAHFAVFPPRLVAPMILAGTSEMGVCARCGAPWRRVVMRRANPGGLVGVGNGRHADESPAQRSRDYDQERSIGSITRAWRPTCRCETTDRQPAVVLDPFAGSGTALAVALQLGRDAVGIDLNPINAVLAAQRTRAAPGRPRGE